MFSNIDKKLFFTTIFLVIFGLIIFSSSALGILSYNDAKFFAVIKSQLIYALGGGAVAMILGMIIPFELYKKYAYIIFGGALLLTSLVFVPVLSRFHGGAHRWIDLGSFSLQPSEFLKFSFVVFVAMWCSTYRDKFKDFRFGLVPYVVASGLVSVIMLLQPDFGTFIVIMSASFFVYFIGGARKNHILLLFVACVLGVVVLISFRPYMMERVTTFFDHTQDVRGSSWQLNQSLIAIGGGGFFGRGLGQSVQKFNYLPEPIGDSIFAVLAEELGFLGVIILIIFYGILGIRGYVISMNSESNFGMLLGVGIVIIILTQAALNISAMIGIIPLTGVPLPFVSHGGTALMVSLFEIGVLLNISKLRIL